jgi:hypothetical protein
MAKLPFPRVVPPRLLALISKRSYFLIYWVMLVSTSSAARRLPI